MTVKKGGLMEDMISRNDAYNTLTEYYHHTTEIQHKALREALERVPDSQPELIEREAYIRGFEQGKTQGRLDTLSAQPETHDKRTETHACDLISRQAVLDAIFSEPLYKPGMKKRDADAVVPAIYEKIKSLPSAQPDLSGYSDKLWQKAYERGKAEAQQRWIPCSERLPEPRVAVLGYAPKFKNIFALYYDSVMGWMVWSPIRDDCLPNSQGDIIAWMPLPESYREGAQE